MHLRQQQFQRPSALALRHTYFRQVQLPMHFKKTRDIMAVKERQTRELDRIRKVKLKMGDERRMDTRVTF